MTREALLRACFATLDGEQGLRVIQFTPGDVILEAHGGDGGVISHLDISWRSVEVDGAAVGVAALSLLCTDPAYRRRGYATALVSAAQQIAARRESFSAIFSDYLDYYAGFGYRRPHGSERADFLIAELGMKSWPEGAIDTKGAW